MFVLDICGYRFCGRLFCTQWNKNGHWRPFLAKKGERKTFQHVLTYLYVTDHFQLNRCTWIRCSENVYATEMFSGFEYIYVLKCMEVIITTLFRNYILFMVKCVTGYSYALSSFDSHWFLQSYCSGVLHKWPPIAMKIARLASWFWICHRNVPSI